MFVCQQACHFLNFVEERSHHAVMNVTWFLPVRSRIVPCTYVFIDSGLLLVKQNKWQESKFSWLKNKKSLNIIHIVDHNLIRTMLIIHTYTATCDSTGGGILVSIRNLNSSQWLSVTKHSFIKSPFTLWAGNHFGKWWEWGGGGENCVDWESKENVFNFY